MKKIFFKILLLLFVLGAVVGAIGYNSIFGINTLHTEPKLVYIATGSGFDDVVHTLDTANVLDDKRSFRQVADLMKYTDNVKPGRYKISADLNNRNLVSLLRSGRQEAVKLTISTARTIADVARLVSDKIEPDSMSISQALLAPSTLDELGMTPESIISLIIPNTYEAYWTMSADQFVEKMYTEYQKYWSKDDRLAKAEALGLTLLEVSALASIVEKESIQGDERPTIAGLYLNRLQSGIHLQADPTVVFGVGDFTIRRVLNVHLAHESPYNTYLNAGLPPGPICMPSIMSIDAVLNADKHDYLFMCAKPGYNGSHIFSKTNATHERNARIYHRWLSSQGIKG